MDLKKKKLHWTDVYQYKLFYADGNTLTWQDNVLGTPEWEDPNRPRRIVKRIALLPLKKGYDPISVVIPQGTLPVYAKLIPKTNDVITGTTYMIGWNMDGARNMICFNIKNREITLVLDHCGYREKKLCGTN